MFVRWKWVNEHIVDILVGLSAPTTDVFARVGFFCFFNLLRLILIMRCLIWFLKGPCGSDWPTCLREESHCISYFGTDTAIFFSFVAPHGLWDLSSLIRHRIRALVVKVLSSNHWTAREFLDNTVFFPGYPDTGHFNISLNSPLTWALISNVTIFSVCPFRRFLTSLPLPLDTRLSWLHSSLTCP